MVSKTSACAAISKFDAVANLAANTVLARMHKDSCRVSAEGFEAARRHGIKLDGKPPEAVEIALPEIKNALANEPGRSGGFTAPIGFISGWEMARDALPMPRLATVQRVPRGQQWHKPMCDDRSSEGVLLDPNSATSGYEDFDSAFQQQVLEPYLGSSGMVAVPSELQQDSPEWAQQFGNLLGLRVQRLINRMATRGTGVGQPAGVATVCTKQAAASASAISGDDLVNLAGIASDGIFDGSAQLHWQMHRSVWQTVQKLKAGAGEYLFHPLGGPMTLMGWPVVLNSAMASTIESGACSVLFGDFSRVLIVEAGEVRIDAFREPLSHVDQVLWRCIQRFDVALLDSGDHPVVGLLH